MPHNSTLGAYQLEFVKICGITSVEDRDLVAEAGADYFGALIDVAYSPRSISLTQAGKLFDSPPIPGVALVFNNNLERIRKIVDELNPYAVQLLGNESPEFVATLKSTLECRIWKCLHLPPKGRGAMDLEFLITLAEDFENSGADAIAVDTIDTTGGKTMLGGTGLVGDWNAIRALLKERTIPTILAGGINDGNAVMALQAVRPNGIDVCTGVESSIGKKDPAKLRRLFEVLAPYRSS
ncbi:MAG: phosphoribosylanthranilate isomerase [Armatimonadota bacterium]|nr:phosphoribosylanthranilate isomerase [Armatimonadota bacterium]